MIASDNELVRNGALRIASAEERTQNNIFATVHANARAFQSKVVRKAFSKSSFDLNELAKGNMTIFIVVPTYIASFLAPIVRLIITTCLYVVGRSMEFPKPPVLTIIDETYLIGASETLMANMGIMAGDGNQIVTVWHSVAQLKSLYPKNWENFIASSGYMMVFGNNDPETMNYFSSYAGSSNAPSLSFQSARMKAMPHVPDNVMFAGDRAGGGSLVSPQQIKTMPAYQALFFPANCNPVWGYQAPYYLDKRYRDKSGKPIYQQPYRYRDMKPPPPIDFVRAGDKLPKLLSRYIKYG